MLKHNLIREQLDYLLERSPESIMVIAQDGGGKRVFVEDYISALQAVHAVRPYDYTAGPDFGIEQIRELWIELGRKPASKQHLRVILVRSAQLLQHEAQTALLKSIEEPPVQTRIVILSNDEEKILPTVRSRMHIVRLSHPTFEEYLLAYPDIEEAILKQYYALSGGLPDLFEHMVEGGNEQLDQYIHISKSFLSASTHVRLCQVETLLKDKDLDIHTFLLYLLRITRSALVQSSSKHDSAAALWRDKSVIVLHGLDALRNMANPKLVLSYLALHL